jgi:uncharacterized protein (TIGR02001 family)
VRGYSVSRGRPVGIVDLSYDDRSGVYLNGSTFGALPNGDDPGLLGLIGDIGYARRLNTNLSVDGGVTHSEYIYVGQYGHHIGYTEVYGGLTLRALSAHLYYSPEYLRPGWKTLYTDLEGNFGAFADIRVNLHVGLLSYLSYPAAGPQLHNQHDWRIAASRQFGAFDVHAALSGGGPDPDFYDQKPHSKTAFVVGAGYTF